MSLILVVDDRPTNRQFLVTLLGYAGHRLLEAADGAEALRVVRDQRPDLVITDLLMPTMDGFEFVQHLRTDPELKDTIVIFYTATYRAHEARLLANACGVKYVLAKPSEPKTILDTVQEALGGSPPETTPAPPGMDERIGVVRLRQIGEEMASYFTDLQAATTRLFSTIERGAVLAAERDYLLSIAAEFSAVVGELQDLNNRLSLLNELAFDFMSERDPGRLLQLFCDAARKITGARYAATALLEPDEQTISQHVFSGLDAETIAKIGAPPTHRGLLGRVIAERRAVRLREIGADPQSAGFPADHPPMRTFMGVPVLTSTRLYGIFYVAERLGREEFDEEDERLALALASQMAAAYENLALYGQIQSHAASLQIEVNERKKTEDALRESEEHYRNLFDRILHGFALHEIICDETGQPINYRFLEINPAFEALTGLRASEVVGRTVLEVLPGTEKHWIERYGRVALTGETVQFNDYSEELDAYYEVLAYCPEPGQFAVLFSDVTERRKAEQALQAKNEEMKMMSQQLWQAAKLATMGELAASIAHELNNPLSTVSLRAEMLMGQFPPDDPKTKSLQVIDSEVKRMSTLVANLLQTSRRSSLQKSTIDAREDIAGTLDLIHHHLQTHNIHTEQDFAPETPLVRADRQQLRQVFLNLFTNAADAMPQGGTLTIRMGPAVKPARAGTAPLRLPATASLGLPVSKLPQMWIEISDTGQGIPSEQLDQVWEPFYTTKPEGRGTGLGLAICRRIIEEHGGTIQIFSEGVPGRGTAVLMTLPAVQGE
jgi:PAS domain S-box-containing protein